MIDAYPLKWPTAWPRTTRTQRSAFKTSLAAARDELRAELRRLGATDVVISTNFIVNLDGTYKAKQRVPEDRGVAVYFKLNGEDQCFPCDRWQYVEDNLHAIALSIYALRGLERWGAKEMVNAAFRGFKALPSAIVTAPPDRLKREWWIVLGIAQDADPAEVKQAYRRAQATSHPDAGGSDADFQEVQAAYEEWRRT